MLSVGTSGYRGLLGKLAPGLRVALGVWLLPIPLHAQTEQEGDAPLAATLTTYFLSPSAADRAEALRRIEAQCSGDMRRVAEALPGLDLWKPIDTAAIHSSVPFDVGRDEPLTCTVCLPPSYHPRQAHPLIIWLGDEQRALRETTTLERMASLSVSTQPPAIVISPQRIPGASFFSAPAEATEVEQWLIEVRRRYHLDEDRVFLLGSGAGGDAAWQWAFSHPREFAGLLVEDGYPRVPLAPQLLPLLLENLRELPTLMVWKQCDELPDALPGANGIPVTRETAVASHNRALAEWARAAGFSLTSKEVAGGGQASVEAVGEESLRAFLSAKRADASQSVSLTFRTVEQGGGDWLRPVRFLGQAWTHPQISVLPAPQVDRDAFITRVLKDKLGSLSGRIDGQSLTLEAANCERIEVLLPEGLVDFARPLRLTCNGKVRLEGRVHPRLATLLEHARQTWTFQRPVFVRLAFNIDSTAVQE